MAQITINEVSANYSYSIGTNSYATVAMPITSCWGPGYFDPKTYYGGELGDDADAAEYMLEHTAWQRFPATQEGLEAFVAAYRGPASNYRLAKDYSYQMAMTLLTAGYDVLTCRICPGTHATGKLTQYSSEEATTAKGSISFRAKYPGTFGNNIQIAIRKLSYFDKTASEEENFRKFYWNIITYIVDASGVKSSVESKSLVFNVENSTDTILYYKEVESDFWEITELTGEIEENSAAGIPMAKDPVFEGLQAYVRLGADENTQGTDYNTTIAKSDMNFTDVSKGRYDWAADYMLTYEGSSEEYKYPEGIQQLSRELDDDSLRVLYYKEWVMTAAVGANLYDDEGEEVGGVYDLLKDKLAYNPNRVISPGWDDQNFFAYEEDETKLVPYIGSKSDNTCKLPISPLHLKIMDVAYYSRCATGYIDVPHAVDRKYVHIEDERDTSRQGYIQKLARVTPKNAALDVNGTLYHSHSAFFAPWGQYTYVGTGKMNEASPSFLALMIQRAQILNQPTQYEWALPTNRKHNLKIGKMAYTVPKKLLDKWQKLDGASVNVITTIPDLGTNLWGNSTLFEVPPVTYQALANLSTRLLVNAVEDVAYRCGIAITFQYNNNQAYNKFYAGVTPLLDTMKNVGAIEDYYVKMAADINGLDRVNANTVIGKIYLVVNGVINDIIVDLIALPPTTDLDQFRS